MKTIKQRRGSHRNHEQIAEKVQKRKDLMDRDDSVSEADIQDDERELYGVWTCTLMSPADPRFIGRDNDSSGGSGENVFVTTTETVGTKADANMCKEPDVVETLRGDEVGGPSNTVSILMIVLFIVLFQKQTLYTFGEGTYSII